MLPTALDSVHLVAATIGFVSFAALWGGTLWGTVLRSGWGAGRLRHQTVHGVHMHLVLLGLTLGVVHGLVQLAAPGGKVRAVDAVIPFLDRADPIGVGFGVLALELMLATALSVLVQRKLGWHRWRALHSLGYLSFTLVAAHLLVSGSEVAAAPARAAVAAAWAVVVVAGAATIAPVARLPRELLERMSRRHRADELTVAVDAGRCASFGFCEQEAPAIFALRSDRRLAYKSVVSSDQADAAMRAATVCPARAIALGRLPTSVVLAQPGGEEDLAQLLESRPGLEPTGTGTVRAGSEDGARPAVVALPQRPTGSSRAPAGPPLGFADTGEFRAAAGPARGRGTPAPVPEPATARASVDAAPGPAVRSRASSNTGSLHAPSGPLPAPSDTGSLRAPARTAPVSADTSALPPPTDTGSFPRPDSTGSVPRPGGTGSFPRPDSTGSFPRRGDTGSFPAVTEAGSLRPVGAAGPRRDRRSTDRRPSDTGSYPAAAGSVRPVADAGPRPDRGTTDPGPSDTGSYPMAAGSLRPVADAGPRPDRGTTDPGPSDTGSYPASGDAGRLRPVAAAGARRDGRPAGPVPGVLRRAAAEAAARRTVGGPLPAPAAEPLPPPSDLADTGRHHLPPLRGIPGGRSGAGR